MAPPAASTAVTSIADALLPDASAPEAIVVRGAREHNLRGVDTDIPRDSLTVITGVSGSGKSSLAFDTIYAEGQRRYMESLSAYARQFVDKMHKPEVDYIGGLSPAISIEQKTVSRNPRSTVGTVTEVYDYLRILYGSVGRPHCPECGLPVEKQTADRIVEAILGLPAGTRLVILAPIVRGRKGHYREELEEARRQGFVRARIDGKMVELDETPKLNRNFKHDISIVMDRLIVGPGERQRLAEAVELALRKANGLVEADTPVEGQRRLYSIHFSCPSCGVSIEELTHRLFSFNSPQGACPECEGIGTLIEADEQQLVPDGALSINKGALLRWMEATEGGGADEAEHGVWERRVLESMAKKHKFSLGTAYRELPAKVREILLWGSGKESYRIVYKSKAGNRMVVSLPWEGMIPRVKRMLGEEEESNLDQFMREKACPQCGGQRLKAAARAVKLGGLNISEVCAMTVSAALAFVKKLDLAPREAAVAEPVLREVSERLQFLEDVGLHYLTLNRAAGTLSGGEAQRTRLATQIGAQLVGVLYVLDEPSIGLHQRDNQRLIATLGNLRDLGNTVIVVEHDESTIRAADHVLDLGPGAGKLGGEIVAEGTPREIERNGASLTGRYLSGAEAIAVPAQRRAADARRRLVVRKATANNLKGVDAVFPLGLFICVTGVSGSGKSTLVNDILYRALSNHVYDTLYRPGAHGRVDGLEQVDKVVDVDQGPIGRTPRSNPATYTAVFAPIRELFARLPESRARGYKPGRFSFNVKGGRCEECRGDGLVKVEMHFLPNVYVECEYCRGRRYNAETLEVTYRGKSIADVLEMTVEEAVPFFESIPPVSQKLATLRDVGLGYIHLGQSATTLSGGEAQRVKLAKELSRRATGKTVYILDEPTTGLHFEDVRKLLEVLQALAGQGNTVVVIEHNLDVIKCADHIIDLGPEGGEEGGRIVAEGTPEEVAADAESITGRFLAPLLGTAVAAAPKPPRKKAARK